MRDIKRVVRRSSEFVAGGLCAAALILITLGGAGLISAQVFLGPKRDFVALVTHASGQRDVDVDSTTSPPTLCVGRSTTNQLCFQGATTGAATTISPAPVTTGIAFFPAPSTCSSDAPTTFIPARVAANDWALARTATGAETINIFCSLNIDLTRSTASKGIRIDSLSIAYEVRGGPSIASAALTSHATPTMRRTTYANAVANSIDATGLTITGTMLTATATTPYLTGLTISAAAFQVTTNTSLNLDWQAVLQNTSQYRLYGVSATYSHSLY